MGTSGRCQADDVIRVRKDLSMMKRIVTAVLLGLFAIPVFASDFTVKSVKGVVEVRRGVNEEWKNLKAGDSLKPEDTMRTGKGATALIQSVSKKLSVPELTMIDISDVRNLTQEEFLLKLAMENILSVPQRNNEETIIPSATVLRGSNMEKDALEAARPFDVGTMQLQGAKVLFDNAFFGTSILKTKETFRIYPELRLNYEARILTAQAFEKMRLTNEAVAEYALLAKEDLTPAQQKIVQGSIERLKQK